MPTRRQRQRRARRHLRELGERVYGLESRITDLEQGRPGEEPERQVDNTTEETASTDSVSETSQTAFTLAYDDAGRGYERSEWAPRNKALEFGGLNSDDYVEVPDDPSLDITGDITVAFTASIPSPIDVDGDNNYRHVLGKPDFGGAFGVLFEENASIDWTVRKGGSRENIRGGGPFPEDGTPFTIVCTHDVSTGESIIYRDGVSVHSGAVATGNIDTNAKSFFLSTMYSLHQYLGVLDRVYVDARVWTSAEAADYHAGGAVADTDRRLALELDSGSTATAIDSADTNDGTITGATLTKGLEP